jgi:hypothetical protein
MEKQTLFCILLLILILIFSILLLNKSKEGYKPMYPIFTAVQQQPGSDINPNPAIGGTLGLIQQGYYTEGCDQFLDLCVQGQGNSELRAQACDDHLKCKQMQNQAVKSLGKNFSGGSAG